MSLREPLLDAGDTGIGGAQTSLLTVSVLLSLTQVPLYLVHLATDLPFYEFALSHVVALAFASVLQRRFMARVSGEEKELTPKEGHLLRGSLTVSFAYSFLFNLTVVGWSTFSSLLGAAFQTYWTQLLFSLLLASNRRRLEWCRYLQQMALGLALGGAIVVLWETFLPFHLEHGLLYLLLYVLTLVHFLRLKAPQFLLPSKSLAQCESWRPICIPVRSRRTAASNYARLLTKAQAAKTMEAPSR